ncbi:DNA-binding MarR family transcriptional regulator [Anaerotaenia torta]|uniref:MarR family winged helix-turn-helix transcriptional regulator n=1 Tax=Anaerotaenia torta TaxID=433293 RepID=UPI003D1E236B
MKPEIKQLLHSFTEIFKLFRQHSYQRMSETNLYPGQPELLLLIREKEGLTQKELAKKHFVKPSSITGMLNKLEANQYVYRVPDDTDKRIMRVYLTPEGRNLAKKGELFMRNATERLFDGFSDEELHTLLHLTDKIKANLNR